jgi:hypothetical protein
MPRCLDAVPPLHDVESDLVRCVLYDKGAVPEETLVEAS